MMKRSITSRATKSRGEPESREEKDEVGSMMAKQLGPGEGIGMTGKTN
jgi:hypothetical protein